MTSISLWLAFNRDMRRVSRLGRQISRKRSTIKCRSRTKRRRKSKPPEMLRKSLTAE